MKNPLSLEQEGALILLTAFFWMALLLVLPFIADGPIAVIAPLVMVFAWFIWFFAWASKGGVPPHGFH